jgi:hypothetical protein
MTFVPIRIWTHLAPQNDRLKLSFVKDENTLCKNMARNGHKRAIYQLLFFRKLSKFGIGNICITFEPIKNSSSTSK